MSNADNVTIRYAEESTFGTAPGGTYNELRYTGESLTADTESIASQEIRSDRQTVGVQRSNIGASGGFDVEVTHESQDAFWLAALQDSAFSTPGADVTSTIAVAAAGQTYTQASAFSGFAVGDWILATNFTNAANNGIKKVTAASSDSITVVGAVALVDEAGGGTENIEQAAVAVNGTSQTSFTFEKEYTDLSNVFELVTGCTIAGFSLQAEAGALVTASFSVLGQAGSSDTSSDASGTTSANTNLAMNGIESGSGLLEADASAGVMSMSLTVDNELRARNVIGTLGAESVGAGKFRCTGSLRAYFEDLTQKDKYLAYTTSSIALIVTDGSSNYLVLDVPSIKFTANRTVVQGESSDIVEEIEFTAFRDATEGITLRVAKLGA
jgi:hypothetical protein